MSTALLALATLAASIVSRVADAAQEVGLDVVLRLVDEAEAPALAAGAVAEVAAHEGDRVTKGRILARLDDALERIAVRAAEGEVAAAEVAANDDVPQRYAEKASEVAEAELRRSTESVERFPNSVSQSQLDVERLALDKARLEGERAQEQRRKAALELDLARTRLEAARLALARRSIAAPLDGVVVEALVRPGEWLEPGQRAFRVVDTRRIHAEGFLPVEAARRLARGDRGRLAELGDSPASDAQRSAGATIVFVSPEVDPITGQVRVVAEVKNDAAMWRPGERARLVASPSGASAESRE